MFFIGGSPLCIIGQLYFLVLVARAILSWFPLRTDSPMVGVARVLNLLTEPVLAPFRRIIPPAGALDMSFFVAILVVEIVNFYILCRI